MATTVVLTSIVKSSGNTGKIYANFANGDQMEFPSLAALLETVQSIDLDVRLCQKMCLARLVATSPDLSNTSQIAGKSFIVDFTNVSPIKVQ